MLNELINNYAAKHKKKIFQIDRSILLVGTYEILFEVIPYKVCINEALQIAKKYSTENSTKFINGILAAIIADKDNLLKNYETYSNFIR